MGKMLFHMFDSQEERRNFGGSAFIEMQFCKLPAGTKISELVSPSSIKHWKNDSLYINDEETFYREYHHIFNCGKYSDLKSGTVDIFGINYYAPNWIDPMITALQKDAPLDSETLIEWLVKAKAYHGFYILGM